MIYVYTLPIEGNGFIQEIAGSEFIHDACVEPTDNPLIVRVYMEPTPDEHLHLSTLATKWSLASPKEEAYFEANIIRYTLSPDLIRAKELLSNSPDAITQPEIWELMRIFGRLLGIPT